MGVWGVVGSDDTQPARQERFHACAEEPCSDEASLPSGLSVCVCVCVFPPPPIFFFLELEAVPSVLQSRLVILPPSNIEYPEDEFPLQGAFIWCHVSGREGTLWSFPSNGPQR